MKPIRKRLNTQDFIERANITHNSKYDYSKPAYTKGRSKICIICPKHGVFSQTPSGHLKGCNCPKCTAFIGERKIIGILDSLGIDYVYLYTINEEFNKYRYDFAIPSIKLLIEYDESHHWEDPGAKSRDIIKNELAKKYNYKLARIPESKYYELDKYIPYAISVCGKYYVNGNFYMTVSELCKYENIKYTGDIKDYDQYLVYKK